MSITADMPLRFFGDPVSIRWVLDNSSGYTIYKGEAGVLDQSGDTSYPIGQQQITVAATDICIGIAAEQKTVETGDREKDNVVEFYTWPSIVGFKSTAFDLTDLEAKVYQADDGSLTDTAADNPEIGTVFWVDDGYVYVKLASPVICDGA
jgi:hypothetical protein